MTQVEAVAVTEEARKKARPPLRALLDRSHKSLLVGVGLVALIQEETTARLGHLATRGESVDGETRAKPRRWREREHGQKEALQEEDDLEERVAAVMKRLNMPTKQEMDALDRQVTILAQKVDELRRAE